MGCRLVMRSFDRYTMDRSIKKIKQIASLMGLLGIIGPIPLPSRKTRYTVLRGPHIDKKSREQFEMVISQRLLCIPSNDPLLLQSFLQEIVKQNLPIGVGIEWVSYHEESMPEWAPLEK